MTEEPIVSERSGPDVDNPQVPAPAAPGDRPRTAPAWVPLAAATFVLIPLGAAILAERGKTGPDAGARGTKGLLAAPQLPDGYEPVDMKDLIGPYPRRIRRRSDGTRFVRIVGEPDFAAGAVGGRPTTDLASIPDLYVQETEVTNAEIERHLREADTPPPAAWDEAYRRLKRTDPDRAGRHPAVGIPHDLAADYATRVAGRLPTGAEWEYVARSGGRPDRPFVWAGPDAPREADDRARIGSAGREGNETPTAPVMTLNADRTAHGIFDLTGNVREWCADEVGPGRFEVRGGSWRSDAAGFSTFARDAVAGGDSPDDLGFRVVIPWPRR